MMKPIRTLVYVAGALLALATAVDVSARPSHGGGGHRGAAVGGHGGGGHSGGSHGGGGHWGGASSGGHGGHYHGGGGHYGHGGHGHYYGGYYGSYYWGWGWAWGIPFYAAYWGYPYYWGYPAYYSYPYYSYPYYGYPYDGAAPAYQERPVYPDTTQVPQGQGAPRNGPLYLNYCESAKAYYPKVDSCPEGWKFIEPVR